MTSRGQHTTKACFKKQASSALGFKSKRVLPGGDGVTRVSEAGEGWGESCSPICREETLSRGVEEAVSKDARRLH